MPPTLKQQTAGQKKEKSRQEIDRELDEDRRQRDLVARVQSIYASQGIEVSADVIAEASRRCARIASPIGHPSAPWRCVWPGSTSSAASGPGDWR